MYAYDVFHNDWESVIHRSIETLGYVGRAPAVEYLSVRLPVWMGTEPCGEHQRMHLDAEKEEPSLEREKGNTKSFFLKEIWSQSEYLETSPPCKKEQDLKT